MVKAHTTYLCSECGDSFASYSGRCQSCGAWNSLTVFREPTASGSVRGATNATPVAEFQPLRIGSAAEAPRLPTFSTELTAILGGGLVSGAAVVLGGDPGIGKSTLALQLAAGLPGTAYVAGEESLSQIALRARRLGAGSAAIVFSTSTNVLEIIAGARQANPPLLVVDSIQTVYHPDFPSTPGSIVQIRESAMALVQFAKQLELPLILVGHVTKEGTIAGPRLLEHLVDVVLYVEGDRYAEARLLRCVKNRFGPSGEVGVLEMTEHGLKDVADPARIFLDAEHAPAPGRVVACVLEGTRPFLLEVQALVAPSSFASPRRAASGFDLSRLHVLLAVLEERAGVKLASRDVYINIVGGIPVKDRGADVAVAMAIASAAANKNLPSDVVYFGELGLAGEIRRVALEDRRRLEIERAGLKPMPKTATLRAAIIAQ